jgi:phospholipase D1/2
MIYTKKDIANITGDGGALTSFTVTTNYSKVLRFLDKYHDLKKSSKSKVSKIIYRLKRINMTIDDWRQNPNEKSSDKPDTVKKKSDAFDTLEQQVNDELEFYYRTGAFNPAESTSLVDDLLSNFTGNDKNYVKFYNDGSDDAYENSGAFADMDTAIAQAKEFIFIVDWSFHPDFKMRRRNKDEKTIGEILLKKAHENKDIAIAIMTWSHYYAPVRGVVTDDVENNDGGKKLEELNKKYFKSKPYPKNLTWRAYKHKDMNWSHHQKFVVLDAPVDDKNPNGERCLKAFFGGLDITKGRFDWHEHPLATGDKIPDSFRGDANAFDDWYNNEFGDKTDLVRQPWHDIHAQVMGPAAWDFAHTFVARWGAGSVYRSMDHDKIAKSDISDVNKNSVNIYGSEEVNKKIYEKYVMLTSGKTLGKTPVKIQKTAAFKVNGKPVSQFWKTQLLLSLRKEFWGFSGKLKSYPGLNLDWKLGEAEYEQSIEEAYVRMIATAENFIYIESQYLIGSGDAWKKTTYNKKRKSVANRIPEALVNRIKRARTEKKDFHVYIVLPLHPEGKPASKPLKSVRYMQWCTIEYMLKTIYQVCGSDWVNYLSFYCLANWEDAFAGNAGLQYKLDKNGNPMVDKSGKPIPEKKSKDDGTRYKVDKNGKLMYDKNGKPIIEKDWTKLKLYGSECKKREDKIMQSKRYMIYVHSKLMIVDDRRAIIGSANLNERSLNGRRDSEICLALWSHKNDYQKAEAQLREFRQKIWSEHLGEAWMKTKIYGEENGNLKPGSAECAELVAAAGEHNFINFMRGMRGKGETGHLLRWPVSMKDGKVMFNPTYFSQVPNDYIPDYPHDKENEDWQWVSAWTMLSKLPITDTLAE